MADVMHACPVTVNMADSIDSVEAVLNAHKLSSVPVMDPEKGDCFGVISLKDINRLHAARNNAKTVQAWEICGYKAIEVSPETPVAEAAGLMVGYGIHHLVVSKNDTVQGFVSSLDVIRSYLLESENSDG
ncbi:MAG: CBS domain-containing protein [Rhodocyclales bacterium]|nr:CBS domain-containing protein [Rhodocyclales bacterium]